MAAWQGHQGLKDRMKKVSSKLENGAVRILTAAVAAFRQSDGSSSSWSTRTGLRLYVAMIVGFAMLADVITVQAAPSQPTQDITRIAEEFLQEKVGATDRRAKLQAGYLDPRLKLPLCDMKLEPFLRPGVSISSRTVVGVRCNGSRPWKVYVPVDVVVTESLLVAKKTLARGHILTENDVVAEDRDMTRLAGGHISNPAILIGMRLKQQVISGSVITPAMVAPDVVIKRGQSVTLLVRIESLSVTMTGKALMDGAVNQRIKVEVAERVVEGVVRSSEYVEILVH